MTTSSPGAVRTGPAEPEPLYDDEKLRVNLRLLSGRRDWTGVPEWEAIGRQLVSLAERDSRSWPGHAAEYQGAFLTATVELLRRRPQSVIAADRPWGLLVARGRFAGRTAACEQAYCGITGRDTARQFGVVRLGSLQDVATAVAIDRIP